MILPLVLNGELFLYTWISCCHLTSMALSPEQKKNDNFSKRCHTSEKGSTIPYYLRGYFKIGHNVWTIWRLYRHCACNFTLDPHLLKAWLSMLWIDYYLPLSGMFHDIMSTITGRVPQMHDNISIKVGSVSTAHFYLQCPFLLNLNKTRNWT